MRKWGAIAAGVFLIWLYGAIHVVYGDGLGMTTCWKVGWSFSDTFVNFENIGRFSELLQPKVIAAMEKCQIVPDAGAWDRDKLILAGMGFAVVIGGIRLWGWIANKRLQKS